MSHRIDRRNFLKTTSAGVVAGGLAGLGVNPATAMNWTSSLEQPVVACVGLGIRFKSIGPNAMKFGPCAALCDVDSEHLSAALARTQEEHQKNGHSGKSIDQYEDYRNILDRKDIDVVVIGTPDHWHTKIAIEALQAGKHVYCEKPLTLTIEEGQLIRQALKKYNGTFQVGTQQRTEVNQNFLKAVALIRDGRIGTVKKITCAIGGAPTSPVLPVVDTPGSLNWDMWLGQAPKVDYRAGGFPEEGYGKEFVYSRCHAHFRWWYEYSGGRMTDWGAHHVDIALWALDKLGSNPGIIKLDPLSAEHPVPFKNGYPTKTDEYNTATKFHVLTTYDDGLELHIRDDATEDLGFDNGIMFEGTKGRFFVNRGKLTGKAVEEMEGNPLPEGLIESIYGSNPTTHMENFMNCIKSGETPISDAESHHRCLTVCHLANIAIRLDRKLSWDPVSEKIIGDDQANTFLSRDRRKGYEITV